VLVMDMKPKHRAEAAEQLDKSDRRKWPALIEAAIRDAQNDIIARLSIPRKTPTVAQDSRRLVKVALAL